MQARDFSIEHGAINGVGFYFGIKNRDGFADALIRLAGQIRSGELNPQKISVAETATSDDYVIQTVTIELSPCKIQEPDIGA
jgi:hypothetical protein